MNDLEDADSADILTEISRGVASGSGSWKRTSRAAEMDERAALTGLSAAAPVRDFLSIG